MTSLHDMYTFKQGRAKKLKHDRKYITAGSKAEKAGKKRLVRNVEATTAMAKGGSWAEGGRPGNLQCKLVSLR